MRYYKPVPEKKPRKPLLEQFYLVCKCICALAIAFAFIFTPLTITKQVDSQLTGLRNDAKIEIQETRKAAVQEIQSTRTEVVNLINVRFDSLQRNVTSWLNVADNRIGALETDTFQLAGNLQRDTFARIDTLSTNVNNQLTATNQHVGKLVDVYAAIPGTIGSRFDRQTDCKVNQLCWQNMWTDVMRDVRYSAMDFSKSSKVFTARFPTIADNSTEITTNFAGITKNIEYWTHPRWYVRVLNYGLKGVQAYGILNPPAQAIKGTVTVVNAVKE